jgi:hypothetical protein
MKILQLTGATTADHMYKNCGLETVQFGRLYYLFEEKTIITYAKLSTQNLVLALLEQRVIFLDGSITRRDSVTLKVTLSMPIEVHLPS